MIVSQFAARLGDDTADRWNLGEELLTSNHTPKTGAAGDPQTGGAADYQTGGAADHQTK